MNKLILTLIVLIFLNNCSFNENSKIWKNEEDKIETNKNVMQGLGPSVQKPLKCFQKASQ